MTGFSQSERRGLARSQTAQAHPDADLLSAFSEQTLTARENEQVLAHLAVCPACREVLSLAATPVEEAVAEPVREPSPWKWSIVRWGAIAASAVIVVIAVSLGTLRTTAPKMQVATETAPMNAPAAPVRKAIPEDVPASTGMKAPQVRYEKVAPGPTQQLARSDATNSPTMLNKMSAPSDSASGAAIGGVVAGGQMRAANENVAEAKDDRVLAEKASGDRDALAKLKTAPPPPQSPGVPAKSITPAAPSETVNLESRATAVDTAPAATSAEMIPHGRQANTMQKAVPMAAGAMRMNALSLDQRWQVTPEGYLLSSTDEGKNWVRQLPDLRFTHVQTIGLHVWACGPDGVLMHSLDRGLNWTRVMPTDGKSTLQGDITSIVFSDANHGTLNTSKDESWATSDGGKSWKKL
jgi:hypothetical protein